MSQIDHVVVLALENRSFDHMLGFLSHPDPTFDGLGSTGTHTNPGWQGAAAVPATPDAKTVLPVGPDHSHDAVMEQLGLAGVAPGSAPTNSGFVTSYERICRGLSPPAFAGLLAPVVNWWIARKAPPPPVVNRGGLVMRCQPPDQVPVLSELARQFAVCTRWFCSVPGETWPNRNFMHAATSDGETDINPRFYTNRTIFELLEENAKGWHIYYDDTPQVWAFVNLWNTPERHANWFEFSKFTEHVASGSLPAYSFIEPNHRPVLHTLDHEPVVGTPDVSTSQHPGNSLVTNAAYDTYLDTEPSDFTRAETLIASVYESLRRNPEVFNKTVLLITYDEHGGLYDHVPPATGVPNPGTDPTLLRRIIRALYHRKAQAFEFRALGPRVPTVIVSPLIDPGTICTDVHDHASIPATLRALFAPKAQPLTSRDDWAKPFHGVLRRSTPRSTDLPDLSERLAGRPASQNQPSSLPPVATPAGALPAHYEPYVALADRVRRALGPLNVPEVDPTPGTPPLKRVQQTTEAFTAVASQQRSQRDTQ
ncbi:MAG: alkaline phosphatase family protein [Actinomycetota bacterium]|nr:alkaline phosphatase family protein [Actinomycetota bacterium]